MLKNVFNSHVKHIHISIRRLYICFYIVYIYIYLVIYIYIHMIYILIYICIYKSHHSSRTFVHVKIIYTIINKRVKDVYMYNPYLDNIMHSFRDVGLPVYVFYLNNNTHLTT